MKAILTYHSIDASGSVLSLDRDAFRRHAAWLAGAGLRAMPLERLLALPADATGVAITFDDAFVNFATEAWPVLRDHGHDVTVFVPTGHAGGTNRWEAGGQLGVPVLSLLDWAALGRLAEEGVTLGSHGVRHVRLTGVPDAQLETEVEASAAKLRQETGRWPGAFAYPYGDVDNRVVAAVRNRYGLAVTTEYRPVSWRDEAHRLPRLDTWYLRRPGGLEAFGTNRFRAAVALRRQLRRIRRVLMRGV